MWEMWEILSKQSQKTGLEAPYHFETGPNLGKMHALISFFALSKPAEKEKLEFLSKHSIKMGPKRALLPPPSL